MTGFVSSATTLQRGPNRGTFVYGFILGEDGQRYFVHQNQCLGDCPRRFDRVVFEVSYADPRGPAAVNVEVIETSELARLGLP